MPLERPIWANARSWRLRKLPRRSSYESAGEMVVCRGSLAGWRARDCRLSHDWLASVYRAEGAPEPLTSPVITGVDSPDQVRMGSRLATLAGCIDCHTPQIKGENVPGLEFVGCGVFLGPWLTVASAKELWRSVYCYGLPDTTGMAMSSAEDRGRMARMVTTAVAAFEPRLLNRSEPKND